MNGIKKYLFFVFLSLLSVLFLSFPSDINLKPNLALALEVELPGLGQNPSLPQYINYIFNFVMQAAGALAILVIIFGAIHYLVSLGTSKITNEGKEWIKAGAFGLLLLMCSWLIMYTINPDLIKLDMKLLGVPIPTINISVPAQTPNPSTATYDEIPIGTLTENLLTRTTDCYNFDKNGDPIDGDPDTPGWEPTLMEHDRVDCVLKLSEAVEKKSKIFNDLSGKITELMNTCQCTADKCGLNCDPATGCNAAGSCPGGFCSGNCVGASCITKNSQSCCPEEIVIDGEKITRIKEKIEHGPIILKSFPEDTGKNYKGLDEFRTSQTTILPVMEQEIEINKEKTTVIKKDVWENAKLIEQLMYLKEKLSKLKEDFKSDLDNLKNAEIKLGKCYLAKTYVEFLKIVESARKEDLTINLEKPFVDPFSKKPVDISRYCKGFQYADAQCFQTCQNLCPLINQSFFGEIKNCPPDPKNPNYATCLKQVFDNYKCSNGSKFTDCLNDCKNQRRTLCAQEYSQDSDEFQTCNDRCDNDSECLLKNMDKCYIDLTGANGFLSFLRDCAGKYGSNFADFKKCADVYLFLCKYGSDGSRCPECPCLISNSKCVEFSYNDDPLTFYCQENWWGSKEEKNIEPFGKEWTCQKDNEIPIGQTIDDAEKWAEELFKLIDDFVKKTGDMVEYINKIDQEKNYCNCDSSCGGNERACGGDCTFWQRKIWVPVFDSEGNLVDAIPKWQCGCSIQPCSGNPCSKMINLLSGKGPNEKCPKGTEYKGVPWYYEQIQTSLEDLKKFVDGENRSEILKKLASSREKMDESSLFLSNEKKITKILNCERVMDNIIYPITDSKVVINKKSYTGYCYGKWIGEILKIEEPLSDNWFFCEKAIKD